MWSISVYCFSAAGDSEEADLLPAAPRQDAGDGCSAQVGPFHFVASLSIYFFVLCGARRSNNYDKELKIWQYLSWAHPELASIGCFCKENNTASKMWVNYQWNSQVEAGILSKHFALLDSLTDLKFQKHPLIKQKKATAVKFPSTVTSNTSFLQVETVVVSSKEALSLSLTVWGVEEQKREDVKW